MLNDAMMFIACESKKNLLTEYFAGEKSIGFFCLKNQCWNLENFVTVVIGDLCLSFRIIFHQCSNNNEIEILKIL